MTKQELAAKRKRERAKAYDARYNHIPQPCVHCKHLISAGNQYDPEGWTCEAFPDQILYTILTLREPHTKVKSIQEGTAVYNPHIYTEEDGGREWHYNADGTWQYVDTGTLHAAWLEDAQGSGTE